VGNNRIQIFNLDGHFIKSIPSTQQNNNIQPYDVAINKQGDLVVLESRNHRFQILNSQGETQEL